MKKKLIIIVGVIITIGLALFLWLTTEKEQNQAKREAAWQEERLPYNVKKQRLTKELEQLEKLYQSDKQPRATTQFIFTELDKQIYEECYPSLEESKFTGVMVVSETEFPGADGCMSKEQFKTLIDAGWSVCVEWKPQSQMDAWWPSLQKELNKVGVSDVKSMYFPIGTYNAQVDAKLMEYGFTTAVCHREETETPLQALYEEGIWHVGAIGFMSTKPRTWLEQAVGLDANITYLVGFEQEDELYSKKYFDAMLDICEKYSKSGDLVVGDVEDARVHYSIRVSGVGPEQEAEYQQKKQALESQIAEVQTKIDEIDARY